MGYKIRSYVDQFEKEHQYLDSIRPLLVGHTVEEVEGYFTGLLNADGHPIYWAKDRIGFHD